MEVNLTGVSLIVTCGMSKGVEGTASEDTGGMSEGVEVPAE